MADIQALQQLLAGRGGAGLSQLMGMGLPRPAAGTAARANTSGAQAWTGLRDFDEVTMAELGKLLERLKARGVKELRVLLLGKPGVGKTSTMNSILNENASAVAAFRGMPNEVEVVSRYSNGFTLMFLDTPGLTSQDGVSTAALQAITEELEGNPVDIVLYVDRLDAYRTDSLDLAVVRAITDTLGREVWDNTIIALTHAGLEGLPGGFSWHEFVERRSRQVQDLIRRGGGPRDVPVALVENRKAALRGGVELPDESMWLPDLVDMMVQAKENGLEQYRFDPDTPKRASPDRRRKWLVPLLLVAQVALKMLVLDRVLEDDGCAGDQYGPYDAATTEANRKQLEQERTKGKSRGAEEPAGKAAPAAGAGKERREPEPVRKPVVASSDEDEDEDEEEEEEEEEDVGRGERDADEGSDDEDDDDEDDDRGNVRDATASFNVVASHVEGCGSG